MARFRLVPENTKIDFMGLRKATLGMSIILAVASIVLFGIRGLNYGIDFTGGILIEVGTPGPADLGAMRGALGGLGLGDVALQEFGATDDVLIRVQSQEGGREARIRTIALVKETLAGVIDGEVVYRRVEFVGPKVSSELTQQGTIAVVAAVIAILIYIWFRFEWQFSIGAVLALIHDVILTVGMFALTGIEFNLSSIAAILTIVGYSINDTVVVYDRVRENLRKFKKMSVVDLLNRSINDTLSRTTMTSVTTLLALLSLYFLGGEVVSGFSFAMIWGVVVGTYSSVFIAAPSLIFFNLRHGRAAAVKADTGP